MHTSCLGFGLLLLLSASALGALQSRELSVGDATHRVQHHQRKLLSVLYSAQGAGLENAHARKRHSRTSQCIWNDDAAAWMPSRTAVADRLRASGNTYGQLVAQFVDCTAEDNKDTCNSHRQCIWSKEKNICVVYSFIEGRENSPCLQNAPDSVDFLTLELQCPALDASSCYDTYGCSWDMDWESCDADVVQVFLGFTNEDLDMTVQSVVSQMMRQFLLEFDLRDPKFMPENVLNWKISEVSCPEGTSETLCSFAQVLAAYLLPVSFYCQMKYRRFFSMGGCVRDPLCEFDVETFSCEERSSQIYMSMGKAYQSVSSSLDHAGDREFISKTGQCLQQLSKDACIGDCSWFWDEEGTDSFCYYSTDAFLKMVAKPGKEGTDPLCSFFDAFAEANCFDQPSPESCNANENCSWMINECGPSYDYMVSTAVAVDKRTEQSYKELVNQCLLCGPSVTCNV